MSQSSGHRTVVAMPQPAYRYADVDGSKPTLLHLPAGTVYPPRPKERARAINRDISRTPSPTPSEVDLLNGVRKELSMRARIVRYLILAVVIVIIVLIEVYHDKIINALKPVTDWLHK
ncbi:hypothetical protein K438DRAFT_458904 [Mycena galopus ATCC 62051]|nr:hypothetical protein K438DRAFT_458904 [Mycena galopus ATCC 62051]